MAKTEWGTKRVCLNCGARFYDMNRTPVVCPACETVFDPAANSKPRRSRAATKAPAAAAAVATAEALEVDEVEIDDEDVVVADDETDTDTDTDEESESAIEDVSELGDDDMSDVIETEMDEDDSTR